MYPTLSDLTRDIFGFGIPLPIQMFGLFVAVAFLIAGFFLRKGLKRREAAGCLKPYDEVIPNETNVSTGEIILTGFITLIVVLILIVVGRAGVSTDPAAQEFEFHGITLVGFALATIFAVLVAFLRYHFKAENETQKSGLRLVAVWPHERTDTLIGIAVAGGLVGAKLFDSLENWSSYIANPANFLALSGLTFYGGLIVAAIPILYYAHQKSIDKWQLVDSAAPSLMLAYGVGRIGCHLAGDGDWGIANPFDKPVRWLPDWLWSYTYPHNVSDQGIRIPGCVGLHCFQLPQGVFPTSLYEFIVCSLLFILLWKLRKRISAPGQLFGVYLLMNGAERFLVELARVNNTYDLGFIQPTQAELISLGLLITGCLLIFLRRKSAQLKH